jgi:DNA polymerase-1
VKEASAININSPQQMCAYFYNELGLKPFVHGGKPSMDDKALAQIFRRDRNVVAKLMQEYRSLAKLKSTYLEVLLDEDLRARCSFNPRGNWMGRLSSSETVFGTGFNMQNIAPPFLEFLEAG